MDSHQQWPREDFGSPISVTLTLADLATEKCPAILLRVTPIAPGSLRWAMNRVFPALLLTCFVSGHFIIYLEGLGGPGGHDFKTFCQVREAGLSHVKCGTCYGQRPFLVAQGPHIRAVDSAGQCLVTSRWDRVTFSLRKSLHSSEPQFL